MDCYTELRRGNRRARKAEAATIVKAMAEDKPTGPVTGLIGRMVNAMLRAVKSPPSASA